MDFCGAFAPPDPRLEVCVVVPAKNEREAIPGLVASLAAQRTRSGAAFEEGAVEVLLLLNNCTDRSAEIAAHYAREEGAIRIRVASVALPLAEAHVGRARQVVMDAACARLHAVGRPGGLICTTDADTRPATDWLAATAAEVAAGAEAVGGRVLLLPDDRAKLPAGVRRFYLLDLAYRRALEALADLYAPNPYDPCPRHHQHYGASFAVTAAAYDRVGGMPPVPTSEDVALYHALLTAGARVRHSYRVRVFTSGRRVGRAEGGLADAIVWWNDLARQGSEPLVEATWHAERRLARLGQVRALHPTATPLDLLHPPEPPSPGQAEPISQTIQGLRERIAVLRRLPLAERLAQSARRAA